MQCADNGILTCLSQHLDDLEDLCKDSVLATQTVIKKVGGAAGGHAVGGTPSGAGLPTARSILGDLAEKPGTVLLIALLSSFLGMTVTLALSSSTAPHKMLAWLAPSSIGDDCKPFSQSPRMSELTHATHLNV